MGSKNERKWEKNVLKVSIWLFAEILLTFLGIDDLADYSEFVFEKTRHPHASSMSLILISHL